MPNYDAAVMTSSNRLYLFDTTLRDGAQTQGVDFTVADKVAIARELDLLGIDYIEGGWPGANPTDDRFFADPPEFQNAKFVAFGMTRRAGRSAANDPGLAAILSDQGAHRLHGRQDLGLPCRRGARASTAHENLEMIARLASPMRRAAWAR